MPEIIIESLNIGLPKKEIFYGREITTGICKTPVTGPVKLRESGFENDGVGDLKHHGGIYKAVCVYSIDHYPYWEEVLGITLPVAAFGENLSVSSLREADVCIGDIFKIGTARVQVSQPRQPCKTLAARYGRNDFVKLVADSSRTGFYFKVLEEGVIKKGQRLKIQEKHPANVTVAFANQTFHHDRKNLEAIEKVLSVDALSESWQESFRKLKRECL